MIMFALVLFYSVSVGAKSISLGDIYSSIINHTFNSSDANLQSLESKVIWNIRLPRVLLSVLVGVGLSVAGVAIQGLFRNPLADSGLIGISAGASLFAALTIMFVPFFIGSFTIPIFAFIGSLITLFLIYRLAKTQNNVSVTILLLGGIAITAISMSIVGYLTFISTDNQLRDLTFWQLGSLGGGTWNVVAILCLVTIPCSIVLIKFSSHLDIISIGEANAQVMGVNTKALKNIILICVALIVGVAVSFTGTIGFIGLVVPHIARLIVGGEHSKIYLASALVGGVILMLADTVSRTLVAPSELPIGVITAFIGAPIFILILIKQKAKFS